MIEQQTEALEAEAREIEKIFRRATQSYAANVEWRCSRPDRPSTAMDIVDQAYTADLVIVSQDDPDPFGLRSDVPSSVVFGAGRP